MEDLPRYAARPLLGFIDYWKESSRLLHMSMRGILFFRTLPNTLKVLHETDHTSYTPEEAAKYSAEFDERYADAEANAAFAEREEEQGFPLLHGHTLVGAWGA